MHGDLMLAVREATALLSTETGRDADALFGKRVMEPGALSPKAAYSMGIVDGAAIALGLTAIELLDEFDLL